MKTQKQAYIDTILNIEIIDNKNDLVHIFELLFDKLNLGTIQEVADRNHISYNGVLVSNKYRKIVKGKTKLVCEGIRNDEDEFPW